MIKKILGLNFLVFVSYCSLLQNGSIGTITPGVSDAGSFGEPSSDFLPDRRVNNDDFDPVPSSWFVNESSNKRIPQIIQDLDLILNSSTILYGILSKEIRFKVILSDVSCKSFEQSAKIQKVKDSIYRMELNRHNSKAIDNALAATLIHEFMHCVLLDLNNRARKGDEDAVATILNFGLPKNDSANFFNNDFFIRMNKGEDGQHELMQILLYDRMVSLLKEFENIHANSSKELFKAEHLIWSGLQKTSAFEKMPEEEKFLITEAILKAKGIQR